MASSLPSTIPIHNESTAEQQVIVTHSRKRTLGVLQKTATDKENLVGRQSAFEPAYKAKEQLIKKTTKSEISQTAQESKRKIAATVTASTSSQTSPATKQITVEDLTSENVSENYWEVLAEKRRAALEESLKENQELYERIATLEDELNQSKSLLAETRSLVEVLTEMLEEKEEDEQNITMTFETEKTDHNDNQEEEEDSAV